MTKTQEAILGVIGHMCMQNNSLYCQASQIEILLRTDRYYGVTITRRGLNYALKSMEEQGLIRRKATRRMLPGGEWKQNRTLYFVTRKMIELIRWMSSKFAKCLNYFRVKCPSHIYLVKKTSISSFSSGNVEKPPVGIPFWQDEASTKGFLAFKERIRTL
jgi:hypothetical protein